MQLVSKLYSVVIPVYNSEEVIERTVSRTLSFFESKRILCEIILINDGSKDQSWEKLVGLVKKHKELKAINFLKNYGQHSAVFCGIKEAKGDFVITMDDDLQNPPEEIIHLINKVNEGYDTVFAKYRIKNHSLNRRLGSKVIGYLNREIFKKPKDISLTNFRIFSKSVAERIKAYKTQYPYIPGLVLMFSNNIANVETRHDKREVGRSNYTLIAITKLISRLLFNYSAFPLKVLSAIGFLISLISFLFGVFYLVKGLVLGSQVLGFTTIVVLLSFLHGFTLVMLGILGEYISRINNQLASGSSYYIKEVMSNE